MSIDRNATYEDCFNMLCGEKLGSGVHRVVFSCKVRPELVVKVEQQDYREFANVMEMKAWCSAPERVRMWLAPCEFLSPDGRLLLQKRVTPLPLEYALPDKMPAFLNDFKRENYGLIDGRLVCIDYGLVGFDQSLRPRAVTWT